VVRIRLVTGPAPAGSTLFHNPREGIILFYLSKGLRTLVHVEFIGHPSHLDADTKAGRHHLCTGFPLPC
jgi:hypothetical protein